MGRATIPFGMATVIMLAVACNTMSIRQREAEAIMCGNQLNALRIAALGLSIDSGAGDDSKERFPHDLLSMSNEVNHPKILICPSDRSRKDALNWAALKSDNISYELVTPDLQMQDTNGVFLRCPIHGYVIRTTGVYDSFNRVVRKH